MTVRSCFEFTVHAVKGSRAAGDRDMLVVRRQLLDNGLIEPPALDRFLEKASA